MRLAYFKFGRVLARVERAINQIVDSVNENRIASAPGYRLKATSNGTALEILAPKVEAGEAGASVQQYRITAIFDDYLEAKTWDGTAEGSAAVRIAKPWRLRKTGWDGVTVTYNFNGTNFPIRYTYSTRAGYRTAVHTGTNATENQAIIPVYSVNDILYATKPTSGTLVTVSGTALTWLDLNVDAREWARY